MTIKRFTQRIGRTILLSSLLASFLVPSAFAGGPTATNRSAKRQSVQKSPRTQQLEKTRQLQKATTLLQVIRAQREEKASRSSSHLKITQSSNQNPLVTSSGTSSSDSYDASDNGDWQLLDGGDQNGITLEWSYEIYQAPVEGGQEGYARASADLDSVNQGAHRDALDGYLHFAYGYGLSDGEYYANAEIDLEIQIGDSFNIPAGGDSLSFTTGQSYEIEAAAQSYDLWSWDASFMVWVVPVTVGFDLDFNTWAGVHNAMASNNDGDLVFSGTPSIEAAFSGMAEAGLGASLESIVGSLPGGDYLLEALASIGTEINVGASAGVGFEFSPYAALKSDLVCSSQVLQAPMYVESGAEMGLYLYVHAFAEIEVLGWDLVDEDWYQTLDIYSHDAADSTTALCNLSRVGQLVGDMNGDGGFNVIDIVALSNAIMAANAGDLYGAIADINGDGGYNVLDIVALANCVLAANCPCDE